VAERLFDPDELYEAPYARGLTAGGRVLWVLALMVVTLPLAVMVPWGLHDSTRAIEESAAALEGAILVVGYLVTGAFARR
jgi:hypothetical protein